MLRSQILLLGSLLSAPFVVAVNPSCTPGIFSFIASEVSSIPAAQSYCSKNFPLSLRSTTSTAPTSTTTVSTNTVTTTVATVTTTSTVATQTNTATSTVTATTTVTVTVNVNKKRQLSTTPAAPSTTRAISTTPAAPSTTPAAPSTTRAISTTPAAPSTTPAAPSTTPAAPSTTRAISTTPAAPSTTPKITTTPKISTTPSVPRKSTTSSVDKWQSVLSFESSIINDICTCVENPQTTTFTTTPVSSVTATTTTSVTATSTADVTATVTTTTVTTTTTTATATATMTGSHACTPGAPGTLYPGQCGPAANSCACYIDTSGGGYCAGYYGNCGTQCNTDSDCPSGSGCLAASESDCGYNMCATSSDVANCPASSSSKRAFVMPRDASALRTYKRASQRHDTYTGDFGGSSRV